MQHRWLIGYGVIFVVRILAEARIKPPETEARSAQRGKISLQLLSLPFLVSGVATGWFLWRGAPVHPAFYFLGMVLFISGFAGRAAALHELGRSYSLYIDPAPTEALRTQGVYAYIRHPVYAFYLLEMLALVIIRPNLVSLVALALVALTTLWRIHQEEQLLLAHYGGDYHRYMAGTRRLFPWIY